MDVAGEITQGGVTAADVLDFDVPLFGRGKDGELWLGECVEEVGVILLEGGFESAAKAFGQGAEVDQELVVGGMDQRIALRVAGERRDDDVEVWVMLHLAASRLNHVWTCDSSRIRPMTADD